MIRERPGLLVERFEVKNDSEGRKRFVATMQQLGAEAVGIPAFVVNTEYVVGFIEGTTEQQVTTLVDRALGAKQYGARVQNTLVTVPWLGVLDAETLSLPVFTLAVGLVDGINPCAMWVLLVLLGILAHVRSTKRLFLVGGTFVVASGVVYFVFMTAWLSLFELVGLSRTFTVVLGAVVFTMGLINMKELVWFKKGVSLTIPDKVKPKLYKRMRGVANAASLPAAFLGVAALAVVVNLIELACTLGLPAVFTRVLSLREELSAVGRAGYLVLYNIAYVVPLAVIVIAYASTLHRLTLTERGAKALKAVSGALLVVFGGLFMVAPELLGG
ncbi:MAG TPA: NrdH-redoxin [Polyangiaceae bacterium]|nr:NrdH-redoxin [Polyangiaceae bacterium]